MGEVQWSSGSVMKVPLYYCDEVMGLSDEVVR